MHNYRCPTTHINWTRYFRLCAVSALRKHRRLFSCRNRWLECRAKAFKGINTPRAFCDIIHGYIYISRIPKPVDIHTCDRVLNYSYRRTARPYLQFADKIQGSPPCLRHVHLTHTGNMVSERKKAAVIGAGPIGLHLALRLAQAGAEVCLFERGSKVAASVREWVGPPIRQNPLPHPPIPAPLLQLYHRAL